MPVTKKEQEQEKEFFLFKVLLVRNKNTSLGNLLITHTWDLS